MLLDTHDNLPLEADPFYDLTNGMVFYLTSNKSIGYQVGSILNKFRFKCPLLPGLSDNELNGFKKLISKNLIKGNIEQFCFVYAGKERGNGIFCIADIGTIVEGAEENI